MEGSRSLVTANRCRKGVVPLFRLACSEKGVRPLFDRQLCNAFVNALELMRGPVGVVLDGPRSRGGGEPLATPRVLQQIGRGAREGGLVADRNGDRAVRLPVRDVADRGADGR